MQQQIFRAPAALLLCASVLTGIDVFSPSIAGAAEPAPAAAAVIPPGGPPAPFAAPPNTATGAQPSAVTPLRYSEVAPGLLERSVYQTSAGTLAIAIDDILVAPGDSVQIPANQFAALLEIEAGAPQISVDGRLAATQPGQLVSVNQNQTLTIDNRQQQRGVVARLIKIQVRGN